jgi:hypothetical protein
MYTVYACPEQPGSGSRTRINLSFPREKIKRKTDEKKVFLLLFALKSEGPASEEEFGCLQRAHKLFKNCKYL